MMTRYVSAMLLAGLLIPAWRAAQAADTPSCDQRLASLQFKGDYIRSKEARDQFASALRSAREDRDRGDERSCQADLDSAEKLLER